ncbi:MAG: glycosyltransferase family 39 protein [Armatimonadota bacterium]|nr:glycosyltransferase family 39 protein [Armatimonadota bacterium]MDW8025893.1 glycosyltransferase family 39 protein [Armatimonadota bacterium]
MAFERIKSQSERSIKTMPNKVGHLLRGRLTDIVLASLLFFGSFISVVWTSDDMGVTYDEAIYAGCALRFLQWLNMTLQSIKHGDFVSPFKYETIQAYWHAKDMHPPFPKMLTAMTYLLFGNIMPAGLAPLRSSTALMFAALIVAVYIWLLRYFGRTAAIYGALALLTMPRVFAHAHFVTLDVPVASATFIATILMANAVEHKSKMLTAFGALALGIAFSCKMNALLAPFGLLTFFLIDRLLSSRHMGERTEANAKLLRAIFVTAVSTAFAFAFLLLTWLWLWYETPKRLASYILFHGKHFPVHTFYLGKMHAYAPWHYPLVMTAVTTPALTLLMALAGTAITIVRWQSTPMLARVALINYIIHIAPFCLPQTPKYNCVRLFMPAIPFLIVLASFAFHKLEMIASKLLARVHPYINVRPKIISLSLIVIFIAPSLNSLLRIHPFELSYYNALVGGTRGAVYRWGFESTYWGVNIVQLLPFLNEQRDGSLVFIIPVGLHAYMDLYIRFGWLKPTLRFTSKIEDLPKADFAMFQGSQTEIYDNPITWFLWLKCKPAHAAVYDGVPIAAVYDANAIRIALKWGAKRTQLPHKND